jgi:hypothetical protein
MAKLDTINVTGKLNDNAAKGSVPNKEINQVSTKVNNNMDRTPKTIGTALFKTSLGMGKSNNSFVKLYTFTAG